MIELTFLKEGHYYTLRYMAESKCWFLSNEEGEGMGMDQEQVFNILDKYFKENF